MLDDHIFLEASIGKSITNGTWETDENGNPIVIIEASNDNLDFQEEKVLQDALMNSKDYFLQNGVISYDHMHKPSPDVYKIDPQWNEEKYILGHPIDAWMDDKTVKVKAVLYKTVDRVEQILKKLAAGAKTVKASVGGIRPEKRKVYDVELGKNVDNIVKVLWDEVALTYKPVNQTLGHTVLSPKEFVKSLTAGNSSNPAEMTGGNTLQVQSLEGKDALNGLFTKIKSGELNTGEDIVYHLKQKGFSDEQTSEIIEVLNNKETLIGDVLMATEEKDLSKAIDESVDNLSAVLQKAKEAPKPEEPKKEEDMDDDDDMDYEDEDMKKMDKDKKVSKSIDEDVQDVTEDLKLMIKSFKSFKGLVSMVKSLQSKVEEQGAVLAAIGENSIAVSAMTKSIAEQPEMRKSSLSVTVNERWEKSVGDELKNLSKSRVTDLARQAFKKGYTKDPDFSSRVNFQFQKSLPLTEDMKSVIVQTMGGR